MKKLITFILYLTINTAFCQNQEGVAIYNSNLNIPLNINSVKNKDVKENLSKILNQTNTSREVQFKLEFKLNKSIFYYIQKLNNENKSNLDINLINAKNSGLIYTNLKTNEKITYRNAFGKQFRILESLTSQKWKLVNEFKLINGYLCYKATTQKELYRRSGNRIIMVTAWYAPELPINFGPLGYGNLPGLIIELKEGNTFSYLLKSLKFNKISSIKKPIKGKVVTLKEYNTEMTKVYLNKIQM